MINLNDAPGRFSHYFLLRLWAITFIVFFIFYILCAQRGVSWSDSGLYQFRVIQGIYSNDQGLALTHPFYIFLGKCIELFPLGAFTFKLNAFSGLCMAIVLANMLTLFTWLTKSLLPGIVVVFMLGLCHGAWWLSCLAEVYTLSIVGLSIELWLVFLLIKKPDWKKVVLLFFVNGIGLSIHNFALLPLPFYVGLLVFLISQKKLAPGHILSSVFAYVLGTGFILYLFVLELDGGQSLLTTIESLLFGIYQDEVLNATGVSENIKANIFLSSLSFFNLSLPLAIFGWISMKKMLGKVPFILVGLITLSHLVFFLRFPVPDQFTFILPTLVMVYFASGIGVWRLISKYDFSRKKVLVFCLASILPSLILFGVGPNLLEKAGLANRVQASRSLPYRNDLRYFLVPWKCDENSADRFATDALHQAAPSGIILAHFTSAIPLYLVNMRDGIAVGVRVDFQEGVEWDQANQQKFSKYISQGRLYIVSPVPGYAPNFFLENFTFEKQKDEVLFKVISP